MATEEVRFFANSKTLLGAIRAGFTFLFQNGYNKIKMEFIDAGIIFFEQQDKHTSIQRFIKYTHPFWDQIKAKDEVFFIENGSKLFPQVSSEKTSYLKDLFTLTDDKGKRLLPDDLRMQIWDLCHALVKISIKYVHNSCSPYSLTEGGTVQNFYEKQFELLGALCAKDAGGLPIPTVLDVKVDHHIQHWGIKVEFPLDTPALTTGLNTLQITAR